MCAKRDAGAARLLDYRPTGSFERFKTKTHFNSLKRLVGVTALAALAVKLLTIALATAAGDGTPLDLLARVPASLADLGAALLVFEVLRTRRPLQLAARSAILVAVSPVLFVASGLHGDRIGVAVALLLLAIYLLVDRDAPLVAGITLAVASRVEPMALLAAPVAMAAIAAGADGPEPDDGRARRSRMVHFGGALVGALFAAWVPTLAWDWDSLAAAPSGQDGPGGLGPGWVLARSLDQGLAGWLLGAGRPLVLAVAVVPAVIWVRRRPRRVYAAVGLVLLAPWPSARRGRRGTWSGRPCSPTWGTPGGPASTRSRPGPPWPGPRPGGGAASPGTAGSTRRPSPPARWPASAWSPGWCSAPGCSWAGARFWSRRRPWTTEAIVPPGGLWTTEEISPPGGLWTTGEPRHQVGYAPPRGWTRAPVIPARPGTAPRPERLHGRERRRAWERLRVRERCGYREPPYARERGC